MSKNSGKILAISLLKCYYNNDNIDDSVERGQRSSLNSRLPLTRSGVHRGGAVEEKPASAGSSERRWPAEGGESAVPGSRGGAVEENTDRREGGLMSKHGDYEARTEALILPVLERMGFELVDVEYVKEGSSWYLRAYIDKEGGITVNDCEAVAREMNELLDKEDFVEESYIFEVSSPGLGRPLKKEKDFARSVGQEVEIRTYRTLNHKKEFRGILCSYDKASVTIQPEGEEELTFDRSEVALIRLAFDW